jgi:hypothetical protein
MVPESIFIIPESIFMAPESIFMVPESIFPAPESFLAPASWELCLPPLGLPPLIIIIILGAELEDEGIDAAELSLAALPESVLPLALSVVPASVGLALPPLTHFPLAQVSEQQSPKRAQGDVFALQAATPHVPVPPSPMLQSWLQQSAAVPQTPPLGLHVGAPHVPLLHWALQQSLAALQLVPSFLHCVDWQVPPMQLWLQQSPAWLHDVPSFEQLGCAQTWFVHVLLQQSVPLEHDLPAAAQLGAAHFPELHELEQQSL